MDLDALFGGSGSGADVDVIETVEADAEIEESDEVEDTEEVDGGLDWKVLLLFLLGGPALLALVIALMWWVIGGVLDGN